METRVGRNEPCPCGSGKKFKRCCLGKEDSIPPSSPPGSLLDAPEDTILTETDEYLHRLQHSPALLDPLGWERFDFGVELFHPSVDDVTQMLQEGNGKVDPDRMLEVVTSVLIAEDSLRLRQNLIDEFDTRSPRLKDPALRSLAHEVVVALENPFIKLWELGLVKALLHYHLLDRALERSEMLKKERGTLDPELLAIAAQPTASWDDGGIRSFLERCRRLGEACLPYIERWSVLEEHDSRLERVVRDLLPGIRSARSARILEIILAETENDDLALDCCVSLRDLEEWSKPALFYHINHNERPPEDRRRYYRFLVGLRDRRVYGYLLNELLSRGGWDELIPDRELGDVAELLARLGDRRIVGNIVQEAHEGHLTPGAEAALARFFRSNGWWAEVEQGLRDLKRGVTLLVPKGAKPGALVKERVKAQMIGNTAAAQFQAEMVREDWNRAYHEDLEWLRPIDVGGMGPLEQKLMGEFVKIAKTQGGVTDPAASPEDLAEQFAQIQDEWMVTPQEDLKGRAPLSLILSERRKNTPDGAAGYSETYEKRKLYELYSLAKVLSERGEIERAKHRLNVILDVEPGHPIARRLLEKLS